MLSVAFFRNLNQGQRGSPSSSQLLEAFDLAGAPGATPFQGNGTVVFDALDPGACTLAVAAALAAVSSWSDTAFVRRANWLTAFMDDMRLDDAAVRRSELSLFDERVTLDGLLPIRGTRCVVISGRAGFAVTENERDNESNA